MKYCPHCDMDFIDSVEICTDCGRPLVDKEEYLAGKAARDAEEKKKQEEQQRLSSLAEEAERESAEAEQEAGRPAPGVYVKRADRYEDLRSSASAFLIVGVLLAVLALLSWGSLLGLPFSVPSNFMLRIVFTALAAGSFVIWRKTCVSAKEVRGQIAEEQETTRQLTEWFLGNFTAEAVDAAVRRENGELRPEVLALKRMNYIQDVFVTNYDIADQSYVDALAEQIYSTLYADEEAASERSGEEDAGSLRDEAETAQEEEETEPEEGTEPKEAADRETSGN